jgi:hypothetical protein
VSDFADFSAGVFDRGFRAFRRFRYVFPCFFVARTLVGIIRVAAHTDSEDEGGDQ